MGMKEFFRKYMPTWREFLLGFLIDYLIRQYKDE